MKTLFKVGTKIRSMRSGEQGTVVGYGMLCWPSDEAAEAPSDMMPVPVYLVQVRPGSSSKGSACVVFRADKTEEIERDEALTVAELIQHLLRMPRLYTVDVDRGGAYDSAKSVYINEALKSVSISADRTETR